MLTICTEIAEFWRQCRPLLSKTFPNFPDEEISHDTVRRITMIIGKDKNAALIERFVKMLRSKLSHPIIAVDGQAVRASRNSAEHSPYVLNIMDADNELILAQQVIGEKNNEITHATKLISTLDIQGAIVTADALNTQTEFAAKIIAEKADYCLALKANQDLTYEQVRGFFELGTHDYKTARPSVTDQSGKITKRKTRVLPGSLLPKEIRDKWVGLEEGSIVETVTDTVRKSTSEVLEPQVRYYISSLRYEAPNVEQVLHRAVRQHWTIENKGHWALDMAFNQDRLQCTNAQYLAGRTLLNKIALNFTTKIQTRLEEATGKAAPSKPIIRARLRKIEDMLVNELEFKQSVRIRLESTDSVKRN
ncbi:ISAs1 family transposase [Parasutterella sp.]|uniref:ISAs1 family transposase n=1 Tax=Parasutterella sp. TaxID=2049037 RepID=UPI003520D588